MVVLLRVHPQDHSSRSHFAGSPAEVFFQFRNKAAFTFLQLHRSWEPAQVAKSL